MGLPKIAEMAGIEVKIEIIVMMLKASKGLNLCGVIINPIIPRINTIAVKPIKTGESIKEFLKISQLLRFHAKSAKTNR